MTLSAVREDPAWSSMVEVVVRRWVLLCREAVLVVLVEVGGLLQEEEGRAHDRVVVHRGSDGRDRQAVAQREEAKGTWTVGVAVGDTKVAADGAGTSWGRGRTHTDWKDCSTTWRGLCCWGCFPECGTAWRGGESVLTGWEWDGRAFVVWMFNEHHGSAEIWNNLIMEH